MNEVRSLGLFKVESGELIVSDPCYTDSLGRHNVIHDVKNGTWGALAFITGKGIVERLVARCNLSEPVYNKNLPFDVYVDSGQAGIFDAAHYGNNDDVSKGESFENVPFRDSGEHDAWYMMCCDRTLDEELPAGVIPFGAVSSSGYGDGRYESVCGYDRFGKVVEVCVVFIYDEDDDEDDDWDEE